MADFISFNEGRAKLANAGLPTSGKLALSTKDCNTHVVGDTYVGGFSEITGTGYTQQTVTEPTATTANPSVVSFAAASWTTGSATNWPAGTKSVVLIDDSGGAGNERIVCAWNLVAGGAARDMSAASTTLSFTGTLNVA